MNLLDLDGLDDDEINGYILSETEAVQKDRLWKQMNAEYLQLAKEREERAAKEREDGKPEKKKRRGKKKPIGPSSSAGEAIEKMLQEKKISSKINYDILKSLTAPAEKEDQPAEIVTKTEAITPVMPRIETLPRKAYVNLSKNRRSKAQVGLPIATSTSHEEKPEEIIEKEAPGKKFLNIINRDFMQIFYSHQTKKRKKTFWSQKIIPKSKHEMIAWVIYSIRTMMMKKERVILEEKIIIKQTRKS